MISLTRASSCPHTALVEDPDRSRAWLGKLSHAYSSLKESYARNACYFAAGDSLLIDSDTPFFAHFALNKYVKNVAARCRRPARNPATTSLTYTFPTHWTKNP